MPDQRTERLRKLVEVCGEPAPGGYNTYVASDFVEFLVPIGKDETAKVLMHRDGLEALRRGAA